MIQASTKKIGDYYKAVVIVIEKTKYLPSGEYKQTYYSRDKFTSKQTALKHAQAWRNESLEIGQITWR